MYTVLLGTLLLSGPPCSWTNVYVWLTMRVAAYSAWWIQGIGGGMHRIHYLLGQHEYQSYGLLIILTHPIIFRISIPGCSTRQLDMFKMISAIHLLWLPICVFGSLGVTTQCQNQLCSLAYCICCWYVPTQKSCHIWFRLNMGLTSWIPETM
jgi:hypothetical protein